MKIKLAPAHLCITIALLTLAFAQAAVRAQSAKTPDPKAQAGTAEVERELKEFFDSYGEDLRQHRREAIPDRYDPRGYFSIGNGTKSFLTFDQTKTRYLTRWTGPKSFVWRELTSDILSPTAAAVIGLFEIEFAGGGKATYSYSASLTKQAGAWKIRVEDESTNTAGYTTAPISGDRNKPGPFKYSLTAQPGTAIAAHRHTSDMKIFVKSGRKFILMGDLDTAKVQIYEAGSTFVIPANVWHVEWWETETVEEIEMTAPTTTIRALPATPRPPK